MKIGTRRSGVGADHDDPAILCAGCELMRLAGRRGSMRSRSRHDHRTMGFYDRHVLPRLIHCTCSSPPVTHERARLVPEARGTVLDVGFGSGLNLPHYDRHQVDRVIALEPAAGMRSLAAEPIARSGLAVDWVDASAEDMPLDDRSVDTAVLTFTLCTVHQAAASLRQIRRVLKPEGQLLFCEHGAAPDERVRRLQDWLDPLWTRLAGGCHLNREIASLIGQAGFRGEVHRAAYLPGAPRFAAYVTSGSARPF